MYAKDDPKHVRAERVIRISPTIATVTAYGETFEGCRVGWSDQSLPPDKRKSDTLVQNSRGDWLRVWWFDADEQQ